LLSLRYVPFAVALVACLAALAFALLMLGGVLNGAAHDAQLLGFGRWVLLVAGTAGVVTLIGRSS
jgi:hypothetical protein